MHASLVGVLAASVLASGCVGNTLNTQISNLRTSSLSDVRTVAYGTEKYHQANGDAATFAVAYEKVKALLKDPDSAKFQTVDLRRYNGDMVVCGSVNAKNAYGGYVGFTRFAAGVRGAVLLDTDTRYPEITAAANEGIYDACGY